jgi:CBS domain-containing protein
MKQIEFASFHFVKHFCYLKARIMRIQVKDFMSTPVITAEGDSSVLEIRQLMKDKKIHAIPIVGFTSEAPRSEMTVRGIVTATDLNQAVDDNAKIEDVMTDTSVHVVHVDTSAKSAAKMMLKYKTHHIVAMNDGQIEGMLSALDFVELVAEHSLE